MIMLTPAEQAWLDQEDRHTTQMIRRHGVFIEYVMGDASTRPSLAYTIGLFGLGHPEVVVTGLDHVSAAGLLNAIFAQVRDGRDLAVGDIVEVGDRGLSVLVEAVPNAGQIAFGANRFYQRPAEASVPLLRLVYTDEQGRFPSDEGYALLASLQPRSGSFTA